MPPGGEYPTRTWQDQEVKRREATSVLPSSSTVCSSMPAPVDELAAETGLTLVVTRCSAGPRKFDCSVTTEASRTTALLLQAPVDVVVSLLDR